MDSQVKEHKPSLQGPHAMLLRRLHELVSLWDRGGERQAPDPDTARELVATWSALNRLSLAEDASDFCYSVDLRIIRAFMPLFCEAVMAHEFDADSWQQEMRQLEKDWDERAGDVDILAQRTRQAFEQLDRTQLFAWFAATCAPYDHVQVQKWLASASQRCEVAEAFLDGHPDLFLCLASELVAVVNASRPLMDEEDELLWETLRKHNWIEEVREVIDMGVRPASRVAARALAASGDQAV
jgi:hypothetical protein